MDTSYNKMDFIIIIIISLLVAFIIGFNIIQVIDSKLSAVTINVPPQNYNIPPIYLNIDKDSNIKQIKLNDFISLSKNSSSQENFDNISNNSSSPSGLLDQQIENFGNIADNYNYYQNKNVIGSIITPDMANELIQSPDLYDIVQDPNFNNLNNIPVLISPDPPGPNQVPASAISQYENRVKLIDNPDSPLLKLAQQNYQKLAARSSSCDLNSRNKPPEVNGTFDGYNSFVDLRTDSYANVTSIGKGMLTPYSSFPVPS
jgi:hypothetical protein